MKPHYWSECFMCGPMVVCGKCGNNSCNAGYGTLPDGSKCDACPSAHEKDVTEGVVERKKIWRRVRHFWNTIPWLIKTAWADLPYTLKIKKTGDY